MKNEKKVAQFFEDKGFYIVLFLCVIAIGTAAYVLFLAPTSDDSLLEYSNSPVLQTEEAIDVAGQAEDSLTAGTTTKSTTKSAATTKPVTTTAKPTTTTQAASSTAATTSAATTKSTTKQTTTAAKPSSFFVKPVTGEVYQAFSGEELVYDRTNGDWRTHNGVDFTCQDGAKVMAIGDGTIEDIFTDDYYGTSVLIDHGDGLKSIYLGLITEASVFKGQPVNAGDVIGAVNKDALFESSLPVHLHLEVTQDGERIDPMSLFAS